MKIVLFILVISFCIACKKNTTITNNSLIGKWKLSEWLADPGDGSGTWQQADPSNPQYMEFTSDRRLIFSPVNTYNADHYYITSDSTIIFIRGTDSISIRYIFTPTLLTLHPPCIEGCGEKFVPAKN